MQKENYGIRRTFKRIKSKQKIITIRISKNDTCFYTAIANYENGLNYPKPVVLVDIINTLQCDANYLFQDYIGSSNIRGMSEEEYDIMSKYRRLNRHGKEVVRVVTELEYRRAIEGTISQKLKKITMIVPTMINGICSVSGTTKTIQIYSTVLNQEADFCVKVISSRNKPMYNDGDVILIKNKTVKHNEIGFFEVNGSVCICMLYRTKKETKLIPFNVCSPHIYVRPDDTFKILGKVIGKLDGNYIE